MSLRKLRLNESAAQRAQANPAHCTAAPPDPAGPCRDCCLRDVRRDHHLDPTKLEHLLRSVGKASFRRGGTLYREGEAGAQVYSLRSGLVKLVRHLPNGSARIVRLLRPDDVTGLEVLRQPAYRHCAVALGAVEACRVGKSLMAELVHSSPVLHDELLGRWERGLEAADVWITEISTGSVAARLARLIRFLALYEEAIPAQVVKLPRREDMASMLGVANETVCRAMSELQRDAVLRRAGNGLYEFDSVAIEQIAAD